MPLLLSFKFSRLVKDGNVFLVAISSLLLLSTCSLIQDPYNEKCEYPQKWRVLSNSPVTYGDTLILFADEDPTPNSTKTFQWLGPNGSYYEGNQVTIPGFNSLMTGRYRMIISDLYCCCPTDTFSLSVTGIQPPITCVPERNKIVMDDGFSWARTPTDYDFVDGYFYIGESFGTTLNIQFNGPRRPAAGIYDAVNSTNRNNQVVISLATANDDYYLSTKGTLHVTEDDNGKLTYTFCDVSFYRTSYYRNAATISGSGKFVEP